MVITVRLFASYADKLGIRDTSLTLPDSARVDDALFSIANLPGGESLPRNPLVAVNQVYASLDTALAAGDEVAFIPPVAGG
jgi:molybdopterin converting factor subunit 1